MEILSEPSLLLATADALALTGVSIYFGTSINELKEEQKKMKEEVKELKNANNVEEHKQLLLSLKTEINKIDILEEKINKLEHTFGLLIHFLQESNVLPTENKNAKSAEKIEIQKIAKNENLDEDDFLNAI